MPFKAYFSDKAPAPIGPYSQVVKVNNIIYTSGQIPVDPMTGEVVAGDIKLQTSRVLENLKNVLICAGSDLENVIKTTIFIKNMDDFSMVNEVYGNYFKEPYPARSCVEVSRLPKDVLIEMEAVAAVF